MLCILIEIFTEEWIWYKYYITFVSEVTQSSAFTFDKNDNSYDNKVKYLENKIKCTLRQICNKF